MVKQMQNLIFLFFIAAIGSLLSSCSTAIQQKGTAYNPQTESVERHDYAPFYQLKTEILPHNLELILVTQLHKKTIPGAYSIKEFTRRLLPNDYMAKSSTMLYLQNLGSQTINFNLIAISIEQKQLPFSARSLSIPANGTASIPLGDISIDLRLNTLNAKIEYIADGGAVKKEHKEKEFDLIRNFKILKEDKKAPEAEQKNTI